MATRELIRPSFGACSAYVTVAKACVRRSKQRPAPCGNPQPLIEGEGHRLVVRETGEVDVAMRGQHLQAVRIDLVQRLSRASTKSVWRSADRFTRQILANGIEVAAQVPPEQSPASERALHAAQANTAWRDGSYTMLLLEPVVGNAA